MKKKFLIINADDFGMSNEFNIAITELLHERHITSTSIMPNGLAYEEALTLKQKYDLHDIGLHLTLTRDAFTTSNSLLYGGLTKGRTLYDAEGLFFNSPNLLASCASDEDLRVEIIAQIKKLLTDGINFTHIDNHRYSLMPRMGMRGYQLVFSAYGKFHFKEYRGIRIASSYYEAQPMNYIWSGRLLRPYLSLKMSQHRLFHPDYVFSFPYYIKENVTFDEKAELLNRFFAMLKPGLTELHIHPCVFSEKLKQYNPTWKNRVDEYLLFQKIDEELLKQKFGVYLISYKDYYVYAK